MIAKHLRSAVLLMVLALSVMSHPPICHAQNRPADEQVVRTRAEVEALIQRMGATPPDWWDSVELTYPPTLDLNWPIRADGEWDASKNVGQYIWDVINPNPGRWKEGVKLVHHLMIRHKDDREKLGRSMEALGRMFHDLMGDWARAAFWWRNERRVCRLCRSDQPCALLLEARQPGDGGGSAGDDTGSTIRATGR